MTEQNDCSKDDKQYIVKKVLDGDTIVIARSNSDEAAPKAGEATSISLHEFPRDCHASLCSARNDNKKVRLLGIDAFEHDQNIYGLQGKDFLTMLLLNKNVCIETDVQKNDVYRRTLGYVFVASSKETKQRSARLAMTFINEELLKNGYAILYDFPPNIKYINKLKKAQIYARQNMLGIWEKQDFIVETPSQWRQKRRSKK